MNHLQWLSTEISVVWLFGCSSYTQTIDTFLEQHRRHQCALISLSFHLFWELWVITPPSFYLLGCVSHFSHFLLDKCWFHGKGWKMCSESESVTFMPPLIIHLIHQVGPLNAFDLYFCITSLSCCALHLASLFIPITSLSLSDLFQRFWYVRPACFFLA